VEEYIYRALPDVKKDCALASVGSFGRRELAPYSDIDIMLIFPKINGNEKIIQNCVTHLWDCGIEASHTVREFDDIQRFIENDLQTATQFFETRFLIGSEKIFSKWKKVLIDSLNAENTKKLFDQFFEGTRQRHNKYGKSPKVLEPNVKSTAGGLRDLHSIEWMYCLEKKLFLIDQSETTQSQLFLNKLRKEKLVYPNEIKRLVESYKFILSARNYLHLLHNHKTDRLEFADQEKIAKELGYTEENWTEYMHHYFDAASTLHRFSRTMMKKFDESISNPISDILSIEIDEDFSINGRTISIVEQKELSISDIMRAFYYRARYDARFSENLRSLIINSIHDLEETGDYELVPTVFFREIMKLPGHVGSTLNVMNEFGALRILIPEFKDLIGFFQPGVYHCYTADEHTIIAIKNLELLAEEDSKLAHLFASIKDKDMLYLALIFHDIAKPVSVSGHEIIGVEIARTVMQRMGYDDAEMDLVAFLVQHHLTMEQIAFRRNLNDASTLNNFAIIFPSVHSLDLLYLVTYADLSAVSPVVWTNWKADLLNELYAKVRSMIIENLSGEDFLYNDALKAFKKSKFSNDDSIKEHLESINDIGYLQHFSEEEINDHVNEIESGAELTVFFKDDGEFTNITILTWDSPSLLSRLCGALTINDLNIHDARIFTRKDDIVIDSFNVTDFRTHERVSTERYHKIREDLEATIQNQLRLSSEITRVKNKWWRIESKFFGRMGKVKIEFEDHERFTIIDVFSPDRLGLLYQITKKMNELGLSIFFAKIATKSDDVADAFYILDRKGHKISKNDYELIKVELTSSIEEIL